MTCPDLLARLERLEQEARADAAGAGGIAWRYANDPLLANTAGSVVARQAAGSALDALALAEARAALQGPSAREAFEAGFNACQDSTDRYGEYHGESLDVEFENWLAAPPTEEN